MNSFQPFLPPRRPALPAARDLLSSTNSPLAAPGKACVLALALLATAGCGTLHSWIQSSPGAPITGGASINVPFGNSR
jgi:hypothetical protein